VVVYNIFVLQGALDVLLLLANKCKWYYVYLCFYIPTLLGMVFEYHNYYNFAGWVQNKQVCFKYTLKSVDILQLSHP
jgi:hypothetical protein